MTLLTIRKLHYQEGTSDKVFISAVLEDGDFNIHQRWWGRVGAPLKAMTGTPSPSMGPHGAHDKLVAEKRRKGYENATGDTLVWIDAQLAQLLRTTVVQLAPIPTEPEPPLSKFRKFSFK